MEPASALPPFAPVRVSEPAEALRRRHLHMISAAPYAPPTQSSRSGCPPRPPLLTGPVYLRLIAKVPKHGALTILGVVIGAILCVTGMYRGWTAVSTVLDVLADIIAGAGRFRTKPLNLIAFVVYSLSPMGSYIMLW